MDGWMCRLTRDSPERTFAEDLPPCRSFVDDDDPSTTPPPPLPPAALAASVGLSFRATPVLRETKKKKKKAVDRPGGNDRVVADRGGRTNERTKAEVRRTDDGGAGDVDVNVDSDALERFFRFRWG
eukprot:CAMPEP_0197176952 /NCGR_PEP_ID=MMETSP1423-20130617/2716_1 /TAXON_ID=476441 /ORGANISM="Pseudo-nitzschia heimii, Strain UNC1101" /LENGTH=125 /DNA_ID=CAMNT_0042626411 /DNA_START=41 /DNA_END=419 /DNA_ORIENTATION=+